MRALVRDALAALGVRRFLLGIHDAAFPALPSEDVGRGSPGTDAAAGLVDLASDLGFDGLQLGPQGATSPSNPSPYDGALFSRDPSALALAPLTRPEGGELLSPQALARLAAGRPAPADVAHPAYAHGAAAAALDEVAATFRARRARGAADALELARALDLFRAANAEWLERDALYDVLERRHGGRWWRAWDRADQALLAPAPGGEAAAAERRRSLLAHHADEVERYALAQHLLHAQHDRFRARARAAGLDLFGDLQIGLSERDAWAARSFLLADWRMGAPPSRTDPGGQAWGFAVLDPRRYLERDAGGGERDGPALRFHRARIAKAFAAYDGLRVDHPHGLVCPWVYRADADPRSAALGGARLFESPDLPDVPELAAFSIARPEQLDRAVPRHADGWVVRLDPEQVERYAVLLDAVLAAAPERRDVACEILSTQPYPLRRAVERHGLGRFRVTQKAELRDPRDVYRGENARPEDWILMGNHDTRPIFQVAERWIATGAARAQAEYLASRLLAAGEPRHAREQWIGDVAGDLGRLAQARFADLFVGPARQVVVYFTDLFGRTAPYNVPGTVSPVNWSQRLPADVRADYRARLAAGRALDVPRALARALRSRGAALAAAHGALLRALDGAELPA